MDIGTLLGLIVAAAVPIIGGIIFFGRLFQRVDGHDEEFAEVKSRLDKVEEAALQVGQLASAIEHLGQRVAGEIKHLVDSISVQNEHVKLQLGDIKEDIRNIKAPRTRRTDA